MAKQTQTKKSPRLGVQIVAVGAVTGVFAGLVVTLYNVVAEMTMEFSRGHFGFFREHPAFIPLLFLALALGSVVIGGVLRVLPALRGTGFAQAEGASRGLLRFRWYRELTGMFAASLFVVFMGLSAGVEGPSAFIGGMCGYGASDVTRRDPVVRRYQVTGGACAGLACAMNAPLTGIIFAYEEAHKRFTPEVFICSFTSVVFAVAVRDLLLPLMGMEIGPFFPGFAFPSDMGAMFCVYALLLSVVVSLLGVAFYYLTFLLRRGIQRLGKKGWALKFLPAFLVAGAFGLIASDAMGGGNSFIGAVTSSGEGVNVFGAPLWAAILVVVALRLFATALNLGSELPSCASVPMMAVGAGVGKLLALLLVQAGMDPLLSDGLVVLGMTTMFTTVVKAPITGIIMTVELTWNFTFLLPAVLCSAVASFVGDLLHTEPLYEKFLDEMLEEGGEQTRKITVRLTVTEAAGRAIRDILWPFSALVTGIDRGETSLVPSGSVELAAGDIITVEGTPEHAEEFLTALRAAVGEIVGEPVFEEIAPPGEENSQAEGDGS